MLSKLPSCLIMDADKDQGAALYECMRQPILESQDVYDVHAAIESAGEALYNQGKRGKDIFPYRFVAMDPIDRFERLAELRASAKYAKGPYKESWAKKGYESVTELPDGNGYQYLRNELNNMVDTIASVTPHLIITAHVKDKLLTDKKGDTINVIDIDLTGKMGQILCAAADVIGYVYRSSDKENRGELMVSFETFESAVMGARQRYLAGQKFPFDWSKIYPDELVLENGIYRLKTEKEAMVA